MVTIKETGQQAHRCMSFRSSLLYVDSIQIKQQGSCNGSPVTESIGCKAVVRITDTTLGVVAHCCNPSTQEPETGRFPVQDQPESHSETVWRLG